MPSPAIKLLSLCYMLSCSVCLGISIHKASTNESTCPCLEWSQVYSREGISCDLTIIDDSTGKPVPASLDLVNTNGTFRRGYSMGQLEPEFGFGLFHHPQWCTMIRRFHTNICFTEDFAPEEAVSSKCFVSAECAKTTGRGGMVLKTCTPGKDALLSDLSIKDTSILALANGFDAGTLSLFGAIGHPPPEGYPAWDGTIDDFMAGRMAEWAKSGQTHIIYSMYENTPRLYVRGEEVYQDTYNFTTEAWQRECKKGC